MKKPKINGSHLIKSNFIIIDQFNRCKKSFYGTLINPGSKYL